MKATTYGAPSAAEQKKAEAASKAKARRWQSLLTEAGRGARHRPWSYPSMKALLCLLTSHRWQPWRLGTRTFRGGIVKDTARRCCQRCRCSQSEVLPFIR